MVCGACPKREDCWLKDPQDESEYFDRLIECFRLARNVTVVVGVFQGVATDIEAFSTLEGAQAYKAKLEPDYRGKGDVVTSCVAVDVRTPTLITSVEHLKKLATVEDGIEFYILLNGGLMSVKRIEWDEPSKSFCIINAIDDTHQDLTEAELATETNIVKAIEKKAFFKLYQ